MKDRLALPLIGVVACAIVLVVAALWLATPARDGRGLDVSALPAVNATLNGTSAVLLAIGYGLIRRRRIRAHLATMLVAFGASTLFLVSYVTYHYHAGARPFTGTGWIRAVYFALLISHVVLAATIVPLALTTLHRAWRGDFTRHRRIARWTLPIWLYVSVTGVLVYWMLHHGPR